MVWLVTAALKHTSNPSKLSLSLFRMFFSHYHWWILPCVIYIHALYSMNGLDHSKIHSDIWTYNCCITGRLLKVYALPGLRCIRKISEALLRKQRLFPCSCSILRMIRPGNVRFIFLSNVYIHSPRCIWWWFYVGLWFVAGINEISKKPDKCIFFRKQ